MKEFYFGINMLVVTSNLNNNTLNLYQLKSKPLLATSYKLNKMLDQDDSIVKYKLTLRKNNLKKLRKYLIEYKYSKSFAFLDFKFIMPNDYNKRIKEYDDLIDTIGQLLSALP